MIIPVFYDASYSALSLPERHRFPITKYERLKNTIEQALPARFSFCKPSKVSVEEIAQVHSKQYINDFVSHNLTPKAIRKLGFPLSDELVERSLKSLGAAIEGAQKALTHGITTNISGGYHHAYPEFGSGFCVFNDLAIAARYLTNHHICEKVLILDLDVHQGDGTAKCCENFTNVITYSMHCEQNFPSLKQRSDYDFGLNKHTLDAEYHNLLNTTLTQVIGMEQPDIILYNAGADIYQGDELGYLNVSLAGVLEREKIVLTLAKDHQIPIYCVSGGGYQRDVAHLVKVHMQLYHAIDLVY